MIRFAAPLTAAALLAAPAAADSTQKAMELGSVLAAEEPCGLAYDPEGIDRWIAANVAADDMGFASTLSLMTRGMARDVAGMSESARRAHCAQTARVARSFGFIAE